MITLVHCLTKRIPSHSSTHSNLILVHNTHAAKYCGLFSVPLLSFQHYLINLTTPSSEQFSSLGSGDNKPSIFLIFISYFLPPCVIFFSAACLSPRYFQLYIYSPLVIPMASTTYVSQGFKHIYANDAQIQTSSSNLSFELHTCISKDFLEEWTQISHMHLKHVQN